MILTIKYTENKEARTANTGFASGGVTCKFEALCFYSSSVLADSFVLLNPPERKAQKRYGQSQGRVSNNQHQMRNLTVCILLLLANISFSQNYFKGEKTYCKITDAEVKRLYDLGLLSLMFPDKIDLTTHIFKELIIQDNSFCDAYFFCGYALRLQNRLDDAFVFMRAADSIANHRSIEFKINLAAVCVQMGQIEYARKKYIEVSKYFPRSPEGYYGIALTSTFKGDYANGIANINIAMEKYRTSKGKMGDEVYLLKAILLTLNEQYTDSFEYFRKAKSTYEESDDFNLYYSLSLLKTSQSTEDLKMKRRARKHFEKIKNMDRIPSEIRSELVF